MSTIDPGKLKVIELRAELTSRGLDVKGNKPVLVQRLKEALEKETMTVFSDTSMVDSSNEDFSATQESLNDDYADLLDKDDEQPPEEIVQTASPKKPPAMSEKVHTESPGGKDPVDAKSELMETATDAEHENEDEQEQPMEEDLKLDVIDESSKPADESSKLADESSRAADESSKPADDPVEEKRTELPKGEKRRRSSPSPQRVQRRRSRSPVKEDEPDLDSEKVLLSWYDSDLNLQIDKKTFLSAKPLNEGAFGYSWAGARTTHGVKLGKVCYEVKITEELKWEDIIKQLDKRRDHQRTDRRDKRRNDRRGRDVSKKNSEKTDQLKSDAKEKTAEEKDTATPADNIANATENNENATENNENAPDKKPVENVSEEGSEKDNFDSTEEKKTEEVKNDQLTETVVASETLEVITDKTDNSEVKENGDDVKSDEKPESMEVDAPAPTVPITKHVFRCGWSLSGTSLQLGETKYSYAFDSHGKFVNNNEFVDYGVPFALGDVIGAYANIDEEKVELAYTINGVNQGIAITIPCSELPDGFTFFPHILSRNFAFELNVGTREEPWFPNSQDLSDYEYVQALEDKFQGPVRPTSRSECEVIMMCGLPGSGKSHWVQEILKENSDKTYTVIGTSYLLEKMTINGKPLKDSYKNRWNIILDRLMKCGNSLVDKAAVRRRNLIIDQTNVFPSAQRRKMRLFEGFKRRAVVVVVSDEEQAKRRALQEAQDGKDVPDSALLEMKANMSLPKSSQWLEEVKYVELGEEEAKVVVQKYNSEGKAAGFGSFNRRGGFRDNRGSYRWNRNASRRDYRDNYRDSRAYQNNRFRPPGGFQDRRSAPGSWNRDGRRDGRGPPRDDRSNRSGGGSRYDRPSSRDRNPSGSYNRNSRPQGGRNQASTWQGGAWQSSPSWGGAQGGSYQNWGQGSNWGGQNQWKGSYGQGGYSQGGYGSWNYYGQYANNWQN